MKSQQSEEERIPILGRGKPGNVLEWENFKKEFYRMEATLAADVSSVSKAVSDAAKQAEFVKLSFELFSIGEDAADVTQSKVRLQLKSVTESLEQMIELVSEVQIDPTESQQKLKSSMLKRFKQIVEEHQKECEKIEVLNIKTSFEQYRQIAYQHNLKKQEIIKEQSSMKSHVQFNQSMQRLEISTDGIQNQKLQNDLANRNYQRYGLYLVFVLLLGLLSLLFYLQHQRI